MSNGGYGSQRSASLTIAKTRSGRFKVYWFWKTSLMSWIGDNFHYAAFRGGSPPQPQRGFATYAEAKAFLAMNRDADPMQASLNVDGGFVIPERRLGRYCIDRECQMSGDGSLALAHLDWEHPESLA